MEAPIGTMDRLREVMAEGELLKMPARLAKAGWSPEAIEHAIDLARVNGGDTAIETGRPVAWRSALATLAMVADDPSAFEVEAPATSVEVPRGLRL